MTKPRAEPGSFRDRDGRIFYLGDEVYRALSETARDDWQRVSEAQFFKQARSLGRVVATEVADPALLPSSEQEAQEWVGALRHERVPFVSYPYEWTFGMLRDAALLQLELLDSALGEGFVLKDSTPYNVQFFGHRPTFIDIPSFRPLAPGEPWIGYLQFCQLYLYPLMLTAYKGLPFQDWLRGDLDGIEPEEIDAILSGRHRLRRGVFTHVYLQRRLKDMTSNSDKSVRREVKDVGFSRDLIKANVRGLKKLVSRLEWSRARSQWSHYEKEHNYDDVDRATKERFVEKAAAAGDFELAWDLGANTGFFSRLLAKHVGYVVALEGDGLAAEELYRSLKQESPERANILPLVMNLANPSPGHGWLGLERRGLSDRGRPDLVVALALLHHLVIAANVPMAELIGWFHSLGAYLVVEMVTKEDPMVKRLLLNKDDLYDDYERDFFERLLEQRFEIIERVELSSGSRFIYSARPRNLEP